MKSKILFRLKMLLLMAIAIISAILFFSTIKKAVATNPDKASMEISDEAITYHYSWDDATTTMSASVPLTTENCITTCIQECNK